MRIGLVGGVERSEGAYRQAAACLGHELEFHSGHTGGRGSERLAGLSRSVDFLVVVTDVNSHGAVQLARKSARAVGVPLALLRRCSPARFAQLIAERERGSLASVAAAVRTAGSSRAA